MQRYLDWTDAHGSITYLAWAWDETDNTPNGWTCAAPSLVTSYDGTPTQTVGATYRAFLLPVKRLKPPVAASDPRRGPSTSGEERGTRQGGVVPVISTTSR